MFSEKNLIVLDNGSGRFTRWRKLTRWLRRASPIVRECPNISAGQTNGKRPKVARLYLS